jgi:hypothetical protein
MSVGMKFFEPNQLITAQKQFDLEQEHGPYHKVMNAVGGRQHLMHLNQVQRVQWLCAFYPSILGFPNGLLQITGVLRITRISRAECTTIMNVFNI